MFEHTHLLILVEHFLAAEFVSVVLAGVKKHRLIGCVATSAWITAAHGSESLFQMT
ncbi:hypothetical protein P2Q57_08770 [Peribacillus frigoritolerans]|nr:hypothetical protein [Peribacillus frigoritolerans]